MLEHVKRHCVGYVALFVSLGGTSLAVEQSGVRAHPATGLLPAANPFEKGNPCKRAAQDIIRVDRATTRVLVQIANCLNAVSALTKDQKQSSSLQSFGDKFDKPKLSMKAIDGYMAFLGSAAQNPSSLKGKNGTNGTNGTNGAPGFGGYSGVINFPGLASGGFEDFGAASGTSTAVASPTTVEGTSPATAVTLSDLAVSLTAAPGGSNGITVQVAAKGVSQTLSCTIQATQTACTSPSGTSISIPPNTPFVMQIAGQAVAGTPFPADAIQFAFVAGGG